MKTVRDACQLQPNALTIKLSDQIEQLDELITDEGSDEDFFEKTHITQGMQDLISEGIARLAGASSQAVFHLKQAMGGGKTHLLVGFGLLAKHPELRKMHCAGLPNASTFKSATIGAFNGRNNPDSFFWGEIASQLGKGDQFKAFWTSGPKAPDEKDWIKLFEGDQPVLILLDEMPPYFHYLDTQKVGNGTVAGKPRNSEQMESGALYSVAPGKAHNKGHGIRSGNKSPKSTKPRRSQGSKNCYFFISRI